MSGLDSPRINCHKDTTRQLGTKFTAIEIETVFLPFLKNGGGIRGEPGGGGKGGNCAGEKGSALGDPDSGERGGIGGGTFG